jgi:hypothetical protein
MIAGHSDRKIAAPHRLEGVEQILQRIGLSVPRCLALGDPANS